VTPLLLISLFRRLLDIRLRNTEAVRRPMSLMVLMILEVCSVGSENDLNDNQMKGSRVNQGKEIG